MKTIDPIHLSSSPAALAFALAALGFASACGGGPDGAALRTEVDLLAELPLAEVQRSGGRIDLAAEDADSHLLRGFSWARSDRGFRWSEGPESEVSFFLDRPRPASLRFAASPYRHPGALRQEIEVAVNGRPAGTVALTRGRGPYELALPGDALVAGENRLLFRYAHTAVPSEVTAGASRDDRELAVSWRWIEIVPGASEEAAPRAVDDALYLPWGTRVDYHLWLPPGAVVRADGVELRGEGGGRLEVELVTAVSELEGGGSAKRGVVLSAEADSRGFAEALSPTGGPARVSLTAVPEAYPLPPASGLRVRRPELAVPADGVGGEGDAAGSGIDGDVDGGGAAPGGGPEAGAETETISTTPGGEPRRPNVVVYLVDTLRADHLGCYGYPRPVSPRLDAFAAGSVLFETAVAQSPWTRPSVVSIFTGLTPRAHGVNGQRDALAPDALTLAEVLSAHGYRTAGVVANPNAAGRFGLAQGFDEYELLPGHRNGAPRVTAWAEERLERWQREDERGGEPPDEDSRRPFFLYLHTVEPHSPYQPAEPFRSRFAAGVPEGPLGTRWHLKRLRSGEEAATPEVVGHLLDLYDAEVAANDAAFSAVLDLLDARGLADDTVVVFTSDHGEEFLEHGGFEHGSTFYSEVIEVPLVVRFPGGEHAGRRVAPPVQHTDLPSTLLSYLGLPALPRAEGRDLVPWLRGTGPSPQEVARAEIHSHLDRHGQVGSAVTAGPWRYVLEESPRPGEELYDGRTDPGEQHDLAHERPVRTGWLRTRSRAHGLAVQERALAPEEGEMDEELTRRLRALGYL